MILKEPLLTPLKSRWREVSSLRLKEKAKKGQWTFVENVRVKDPQEIPSRVFDYFSIHPKTSAPLSDQERLLLSQVFLHEFDEGIRLLHLFGLERIARQLADFEDGTPLSSKMERLRNQVHFLKSNRKITQWVEESQKIRNDQVGTIEVNMGPCQVVGITDLGINYKPCNQDAILVLPDHLTLAMADGMGGLFAGETASCINIDFFEHAILNGASLEEGFLYANDAILYRGKDFALNGPSMPMGTTFLAFQLQNKNASIHHMGDVKALHLRGGKKLFETFDHTHGQDLLRSGLVDHVTARDLNHVLTRCLGIDHICLERDVEQSRVVLEEGDRILIVSDGVSDNFFDSSFRLPLLVEMASSSTLVNAVEAIWKETKRRMLCEKLSDGKRSKPDNFSIILLEYHL